MFDHEQCRMCKYIFTGRDVKLLREDTRTSVYMIHCSGCGSKFMVWVQIETQPTISEPELKARRERGSSR